MRKLDAFQLAILQIIANLHVGSFCPPDDFSVEALSALDDLVKAKRIRTEETDAGPRYHLTGQGVVDARA